MISQAPARPEDMAFVREHIERFQLDPERVETEQFTIFWDEDRIVAFGRIKPYPDGTIELGSIGVVEEMRNRGVGQLVVRTMMRQFPVDQIWITTDLPGYFEQLGFVRVPAERTPEVLADKM